MDRPPGSPRRSTRLGRSTAAAVHAGPSARPLRRGSARRRRLLVGARPLLEPAKRRPRSTIPQIGPRPGAGDGRARPLRADAGLAISVKSAPGIGAGVFGSKFRLASPNPLEAAIIIVGWAPASKETRRGVTLEQFQASLDAQAHEVPRRSGRAASPRALGGLDHRFPRVQWLASRSAHAGSASTYRRRRGAPCPTGRRPRENRRRFLPGRRREARVSAGGDRRAREPRPTARDATDRAAAAAARRARGRQRREAIDRGSQARVRRAVGGVARAGQAVQAAVVPRAGLRWQSLPEVQLAIAGVQDAARALLAAKYGPEPRLVRAELEFPASMPDPAGPAASLTWRMAPTAVAPTPCSTSSSTP